jgi:hypothetical protein
LLAVVVMVDFGVVSARAFAKSNLIHDALNKQRTENGLPTITWNDE